MPDELTSSLQVCLAVPESAAWVQSGESAVIYNLSQSGCCCCYREKEKAQQQAGRIWCGEKQKGSRRKKMPPVEWDDVESGREGKGLRMTGVKL